MSTTSDDRVVRLSCRIDGLENCPNQLFFEISSDSSGRDRISADPSAFLVAMIIPAMEQGVNIHFSGTVGAVLLHKLNRYVIPFLDSYHPFLNRVAVTADHVSDAVHVPNGLGAMTGMSCGVDSLDTMVRYTHPSVPGLYRVRSLAVFDVGAFNDVSRDISIAKRDRVCVRAAQIAKGRDCDFYMVSSNMADFYETNFPKSVSMRNVACAFALSDICESYLGASAVGFMHLNYHKGISLSLDLADQILYPIFAGTRLEILSTSVDIDRTAKILALMNDCPEIVHIDVCTQPETKRPEGKNCGTCIKCSAFLFLAEAFGTLDKYGARFNLPEYHRRKWRIFQKNVARTYLRNSYANEFTSCQDVNSLLARGFVPPKGAITVGKIIGLNNRFRSLFK